MRIVYINRVRWPSNIPASPFTTFNTYAMARRGAEVHLFVRRASDQPPEEVLRRDFGLTPLPNFHIAPCPPFQFAGRTTNQGLYWHAARQILRLHRRDSIHALISRDPACLPYLCILRGLTGIPIFYESHNFYVDLRLRPDLPPANRVAYHLWERCCIPMLDGMFCLQAPHAELYRRYFPKGQIGIARPGIARIEPARADRYASRCVAYIGSFQPFKGIDVLLDALRELRDPSVHLLAIGGRTDRAVARVRERVQTLGLTDRVTLTGWLPYTELESLLDRVSVGVIPLRNTFYNRYLTAPSKLFDYLSRGIPIVASDLPSIRDFMDHKKEGLLIRPDDPHRLTAALRQLLASESLFRSCERNARRRAKTLLWDRRAGTILDFVNTSRRLR